MAPQDNQLLVRGFGASLDLSELRFKPSGSADGKSDDFTKDADRLVDNLIDPQWVVPIRIVQPE